LQLTAAKLNLKATQALYEGYDWCTDDYSGKTIQEWIALCEATYCPGGSAASRSPTIGECITTLDDFNNSEDHLADSTTPEPFDRPPIDDFGNVAGADSTSFTAAQSGGVVIGWKLKGGKDCSGTCPLPAPPA
jgi:hypothetical protein